MRAVVQRVISARVEVGAKCVAEMDAGLLVLVGVAAEDDAAVAEELAQKIVHLRIFEDAQGRMNRSLLDEGGTLGVVSQFTLMADVRKGRRPSFNQAGAPDLAEPLVERVAECAHALGVPVVSGRFRSHMRVSLVNDGPVTVLIDTDRRF